MSRSISDFDVLHMLGDGAFSRVWLVSEKNTGGVYAMKVQEKKHLLRKRSVARAILEREILARLDHHFVAKLVYAFQTKSKLCLVLEHIDGGTLGELQEMMPGHYFRERAVRFAASEVLVALDYIHRMGIIYRDLKPENIREFLFVHRVHVHVGILHLCSRCMYEVAYPCAQHAFESDFCHPLAV